MNWVLHATTVACRSSTVADSNEYHTEAVIYSRVQIAVPLDSCYLTKPDVCGRDTGGHSLTTDPLVVLS